MLQNTFQHIPGIGPKTEEKIWAAGLRDWHAVAEFPDDRLPRKTIAALQAACPESQVQLDRGNPVYFEKLLTAALGWRLFPEFRNRTAYVDIETDGLDTAGGRKPAPKQLRFFGLVHECLEQLTRIDVPHFDRAVHAVGDYSSILLVQCHSPNVRPVRAATYQSLASDIPNLNVSGVCPNDCCGAVRRDITGSLSPRVR